MGWSWCRCSIVTLCRFRGLSMEHASGVAQQMRNHDYDRPANVAHDRRKSKADGAKAAPTGGFFHTGLTRELQRSLVEYARRAAKGARVDGRVALKEHDADKLARREERLTTLLNAAVDAYAYALELFAAWQAQRLKSKQELAAALAGKPEAQQLELLRKQIEMRVLGCGWTKYQTRWSSNKDAKIGTVAHLTSLLEEILVDELARARFTAGTERGLPTEAAPPQHRAREISQLGTLDADAAAIRGKALFSTTELRAKAEAAMQRRVEAGIADPVENMQPVESPPFDQTLVGKWLEVLWKYTNKETGEDMLIWMSGKVVRVADGLTDKRSARAKKILPAGALLWAWEADGDREEAAGEQWLILLPGKWNRQVVYGWRFDPRERETARAERERQETPPRAAEATECPRAPKQKKR